MSLCSYSQLGEDVLVYRLFESMRMSTPTYLDIGAHSPFFLNNTALLYSHGSRGVNVEPNPDFIKDFAVHRPHDINLQTGVSPDGGELDYHRMSSNMLNSFSKSEIDKMLLIDSRLTQLDTIKIKTMTVSEIVKNHCGEIFPDFLNLDTEGTEFEILQSIDWKGSIPVVVCVEMVEYSLSDIPPKKQHIHDFMESVGYVRMCDNYLNSIYVYKDRWVNRKR